MSVIDADSLKRLVDSGEPPVLLDVRPVEHFDRARLPGAVNACVYLMSFLDDVGKLGVPKDRPIVAYGTGPGSLASADAARKLARAGYGDVREYRGGLAEWTEAAHPVEGTAESAEAPAGPPALETLTVDAEKSRLRWTGRNLAGRHVGEISIASGAVELRDGTLAAGEVVIDMTGITCEDIPDESVNRMLIDHLESDDFFDVERFPEARFEFREVAPIRDADPGVPNFRCRGALRLKGTEGEVEFPVTAGRNSEGEWVAQAWFDFDRTAWGVNYGSGRLYDLLGMHLVNDAITLEFVLFAR